MVFGMSQSGVYARKTLCFCRKSMGPFIVKDSEKRRLVPKKTKRMTAIHPETRTNSMTDFWVNDMDQDVRYIFTIDSILRKTKKDSWEFSELY